MPIYEDNIKTFVLVRGTDRGITTLVRYLDIFRWSLYLRFVCYGKTDVDCVLRVQFWRIDSGVPNVFGYRDVEMGANVWQRLDLGDFINTGEDDFYVSILVVDWKDNSQIVFTFYNPYLLSEYDCLIMNFGGNLVHSLSSYNVGYLERIVDTYCIRKPDLETLIDSCNDNIISAHSPLIRSISWLPASFSNTRWYSEDGNSLEIVKFDVWGNLLFEYVYAPRITVNMNTNKIICETSLGVKSLDYTPGNFYEFNFGNDVNGIYVKVWSGIKVNHTLEGIFFQRYYLPYLINVYGFNPVLRGVNSTSIPGVEILQISDKTPNGTGVLTFTAPNLLKWQSPGDTPGNNVILNTDGIYKIVSGNGFSYIVVRVKRDLLPNNDKTDNLILKYPFYSYLKPVKSSIYEQKVSFIWNGSNWEATLDYDSTMDMNKAYLFRDGISIPENKFSFSSSNKIIIDQDEYSSVSEYIFRYEVKIELEYEFEVSPAIFSFRSFLPYLNFFSGGLIQTKTFRHIQSVIFDYSGRCELDYESDGNISNVVVKRIDKNGEFIIPSSGIISLDGNILTIDPFYVNYNSYYIVEYIAVIVDTEEAGKVEMWWKYSVDNGNSWSDYIKWNGKDFIWWKLFEGEEYPYIKYRFKLIFDIKDGDLFFWRSLGLFVLHPYSWETQY